MTSKPRKPKKKTAGKNTAGKNSGHRRASGAASRARRSRVDPVLTEIIRNGVMAVTEEMKSNLTRTAYNPIIYEALDFTVGIFTPDGRTVSIGLGLPMFIRGMAQTVQLMGTIVHDPKLIVLDEPFSGLDALNQAKLEKMIRAQAAKGVTVIFSTHVIAHAERLCERIAIIAKGKISFDGLVSEARDRLRPQVHLETETLDGPWRRALPAETKAEGHYWHFTLPETGVEPLLIALVEGKAGIRSLSIERPGLHDAFVAIAGEAVAAEMDDAGVGETT